MANFYGLDNREVIRVHVKKCDGLLQPEHKKFSLDPQITSFEMLQNILARAFDIKGDFTISYLSEDEKGQETYLSMLSDWDMDAAFQNASNPCLRLKVDLRPFDDTLEDWDIVAPVDIPQYRMANFLDKNSFLGSITGTISNQVGRTMTQMQKAMGLKGEDENAYKPVKAPMTDMEFRNYMDSDGHMVKPEEFRLSIYQGGTEHSLRRVVWRHLLNIFPTELSGRERFSYMKKKEGEYIKMRDNWKDVFAKGSASEEARHVASLVKKDVLRTDRTHKFYAGGDDSKNLISLFHLLVTYALTHPDVSYCQGMSDLASPLLVVQKEEAQAYLCFCGLMERMKSNFHYDGKAMTTKFQHLQELVQLYDPVFFTYLKEHGAEDLFFCYRWLLLEMKREFPYEDSMYMLEVMWSTLPPNPPALDLKLTEYQQFTPALISVSPHSPTFSVKQTLYAHMLAKRRTSVPKPKDVPHSPTMPQSPTNMCHKDNESLKPSDIPVSAVPTNSEPKSETVVPMSHLYTVMEGQSNNSSVEEEQNGHVSSDLLSPGRSDLSGSNQSKNSDDNEISFRSRTSQRNSSSSGSSLEDRLPSFVEVNVSSAENMAITKTKQPEKSLQKSVESAFEEGSLDSHGSLEILAEDLNKLDVDRVLPSNIGSIQNNSNVHVCSEIDNQSDDEDEVNQSQFHLSLEKNETRTEFEKPVDKNMPKIKGSFFSGMKKILTSPTKQRLKIQIPEPRHGKTYDIDRNERKIDSGNNVQNMKERKNVNSNGPNSVEIEGSLELLCHRQEMDSRMRASVEKSKKVESHSPMAITKHEHKHRSPKPGRVTQNSPSNEDRDQIQTFHTNKHQSQGKTIPSRNSPNTRNFPNSTNGPAQSRSPGSPGNFRGQLKGISPGSSPKTKPTPFNNPQYPYNVLQLKSDTEAGPGRQACCEASDFAESEMERSEEIKDEVQEKSFSVGSAEECTESLEGNLSSSQPSPSQLPSPADFGHGNPFLMFLCLTVLLQHRTR